MISQRVNCRWQHDSNPELSEKSGAVHDPGLGRQVSKSDREMCLTHSEWTDQDHVLVSLDEAERTELLHRALWHPGGELVVEFINRIDRRETRQARER